MSRITIAQEKTIKSLQESFVTNLVYKGIASITIGENKNKIKIDIDSKGNIIKVNF